MKRLKKVLKRCVQISFLFLLVLYIVFVQFTKPKSDEEVLQEYKTSTVTPQISYKVFKGFPYRMIAVKKDTTLPTIIFVHGTIGSLRDFSKYMSDSLLQTKANFIAYDRVGYNYKDKNHTQESIAFENAHLKEVMQDIPPSKVVLVGYSYGGSIALSVKEKMRKTILLAPAVYSEVEPMPWLLNFYKWKLTRWLVPRIWKEASKEKLSHPTDLKNFENNWHTTQNSVTSIHGTKDWIVPISNSEFLAQQFSKEQFKLIKLKDVGHELIWSNFDFIKQHLIRNLD